MKIANDYQIGPGKGGLEWYSYYTPGLRPFKTKTKVVEALNLGIEVYRYDKIMDSTEKWDGENWTNINKGREMFNNKGQLKPKYRG